MKKLFLLMLGIVAMLASCTRDQEACLTFSAEGEQEFSMNFDMSQLFTLGADEYFEYSVGDGEWTRFTTSVSEVAFGGALGDLRLRGKSIHGTATTNDIFSTILFATEVPVDCRGDIRTLIDYENYLTVSTEEARFCFLFLQNSQLRTAPALPATTLANNCYNDMFCGCSSLQAAPELPATILADSCYCDMFSDCTSLQAAPALPATTLAESCYAQMFFGCTSLETAPELVATDLADNCYYDMFLGCTSLQVAPALPATTLANSCYGGMFSGCTSLQAAPELPATTLAESCYAQMFSGCTKLTKVSMLATDVSAESCLVDWLNEAGTEASSRTLTLANQDIYKTLNTNEELLPNIWQEGNAEISCAN
ncbi:MAG: hypothetical protein ACI308_02280 [Muribaculaceae bacterium]